MRSTAGECAQSADERAVEHAGLLEPAPHVPQGLDRLGGRPRRYRHTVHRSDGRSQDQIGTDTALQQGAEHSDLVGSQVSAAAEDEGHGPLGDGCRHPRHDSALSGSANGLLGRRLAHAATGLTEYAPQLLLLRLREIPPAPPRGGEQASQLALLVGAEPTPTLPAVLERRARCPEEQARPQGSTATDHAGPGYRSFGAMIQRAR